MLNNITYSPNLNNNSLFEGKEFASRVNYKKVMGNSTNFTGAFKSNNDDNCEWISTCGKPYRNHLHYSYLYEDKV